MDSYHWNINSWAGRPFFDFRVDFCFQIKGHIKWGGEKRRAEKLQSVVEEIKLNFISISHISGSEISSISWAIFYKSLSAKDVCGDFSCL